MNDMTDAIAALERSYDDLAKVIANLAPEDWAQPTCCPEWDVRALVNHILGAGLMFALVNAGELAGEDAGDVLGDDPNGAVARTAATNLDSWRAPGALDGDRTYPWGTFPAVAGLVINLGEVLLHTWDVARATRQPASIDAEAALLVYDLYARIPMDAMRAAGVYGPEIVVPESAPIQDRLLVLLSREQSA